MKTGFLSLISVFFFGIAVVCIIPLQSVSTAAVCISYSILSLSAVLCFGLTRILNFGLGVAFGLSAYTSAYLLDREVSLILFPVVVVLLGAFIGLVHCVLFGLVRFHEAYMALVTIVLVLICRHFILATPELTGGSNGFPLEFPSSGNLPTGAITYGVNSYYQGLVVLSVLMTLGLCLKESLTWKVIILARDTPDQAEAWGVNVRKVKFVLVTASCVVGALGGWVYAISAATLDPELFGSKLGLLALSWCVLGGGCRFIGPAIVAFSLTLGQSLLGYRLGEYVVMLTALITVVIVISQEFTLRNHEN